MYNDYYYYYYYIFFISMVGKGFIFNRARASRIRNYLGGAGGVEF